MLLKSEAEKDLSNPTSSSDRRGTQPHGASEMTPLSVLEILAASLAIICHLFLSLWQVLPNTGLLVKKEGYTIIMQGLNYVKQAVLERERWDLLRCRGLHMS